MLGTLEGITLRLHMEVHAKAIERLAEQIAALLKEGDIDAADIKLIDAARRDYSNRFERLSIRYLLDAMGEGEEDESAEKENQRSYRNVLIRHVFGWILVIVYIGVLAFYVVLFGIAHGPTFTNSWFQSFFICFAESLFILIPLKYFLQFFVVPKMVMNEIDMNRLHRLPTYSVSVITADRFPELPASKLIRDRNTHELIVHSADFAFKVVTKRGQWGRIWQLFEQWALIISFGLLLLLPNIVQDTVWDTTIYLAFNFSASHIAVDFVGTSPYVFWGVACALLLLAMLHFNREKLCKNKCGNKETTFMEAPDLTTSRA